MSKMEMYRLFIPYKDKEGKKIEEEIRSAFMKEIKLRCCEVNKGVTTYEGNGGWIGKGELIEEPVTILETYGRNPLSKSYWRHYATFLKQECLLAVSGVEFNTVLTNSGVDLSFYKNTKILKMKDGKVISYRDDE